jgi:hypothetical protein
VPPPQTERELPRLQRPVRGQRLARKGEAPASPLTPTQRLLVLNAWRRSGVTASPPLRGRRAARPAGGFVLKILVSKDWYVQQSIRYRDDSFLCEKRFGLYIAPPTAGGINEFSVCPETRQPHRPRGHFILEYDVGWP